MSLDIYLKDERPTCAHCGRGEPGETLYWADYTHNVGAMWRKAGVFDALYESDGTVAEQWLPALRAGLTDMKANRAAYLPLNPANGWGDVDGATEFLEKFLSACEAHPKATVRVSR
jgi:hypothetical protein